MIRRAINKIRIERFKKRFASIGAGSGFGVVGYGDTCRIGGPERMSVGEDVWFGRGCVIHVLSPLGPAIM